MEYVFLNLLQVSVEKINTVKKNKERTVGKYQICEKLCERDLSDQVKWIK